MSKLLKYLKKEDDNDVLRLRRKRVCNANLNSSRYKRKLAVPSNSSSISILGISRTFSVDWLLKET